MSGYQVSRQELQGKTVMSLVKGPFNNVSATPIKEENL